jgi:hypothetical protein
MKNPYFKNNVIAAFLCTFLLTGLLSATSIVSPKPDYFVAATPCDLVMRPFLRIPMDMDCELVKWNLTLKKSPNQARLSTFTLDYAYGMSKAGTQGLNDEQGKGHMEGVWKEMPNKGPLPGKVIVSLQPNDLGNDFSFISLNINVMHLLDHEGKLMIGNSGWSYTLNKAMSGN